MQTMTNYPGVLLRALAGAGAVVGLIVALAEAAVAAPAASVTITERTAAAIEKTAKAPRVMTEVKASTFILDTAAQRLKLHAQKTGAGNETAPKLVARTGPPPARAAAKAGPAAPRVAPAKPAPHSSVRLAQADAGGAPTTVTADYGDLKTAPAAGDQRIREFGSAAKPSYGPQTRTLKLGESQVLGFRWVSKVAIGNPSVADVVALSDNKVLVNTKGLGETNLFVWDKDGQHEFKVVVAQGTQNLNDVARLVARDLGRDDIKVQAINDTLFLFGKVKTAAEQQQAQAVAAAYTKNVQSFIQLAQDNAPAPEHPAAVDVANTLNQIFAGGSVRARALSDGTTVVLEGSATGDVAEQARHVAAAMAKGVTVVDYFQPSSTGLRQVMVRSRVIDIDRVKSRELGIDWGPVQTVLGAGGIVQRIVGEQPFNFGELAGGPFKIDQGGPVGRFDPIGFKLRALENQNAARVLSQPNLVVMEGHKGGILIGGEIPIPVAQQAGSGNGTSITVEYKPFGIRLDVEVQSIADDGMMTLRISPEVSALDYTNAVTVNGFNLPALRTRRADSVVKIRNGQTLAIGGLLQNDINKQVKAIPLLSKIPVIGELFKDTRFQKGESELVILVTPELPGPDNTVSTPIPNVELTRPDPKIKTR